MKIMAGTVTGGRIVVEGEQLTEGEQVTVLRREGNEMFHVSPDEKRQLLVAIDQTNQGNFVDADELLAELDEPN